MDGSLRHLARILGAAVGAFAGIVALQFIRLRRLSFLPRHPGFYINHVVGEAEVGATVAGDDRRLRLIVLGDSTTAGVGVDRAEDSLPYLLAARLAAAHARKVHVTSYGWAGARVADLAGDQLPRALGPLRAGETEPVLPGADMIAVVIGANDATHRTPPWRYRRELRSALTIIRDSAPRARVVVAGIPAFRGALREVEPLIWITDQYARLLRPISRDEADRVDASFADLAREVPPRIRGRTDVLSVDRFHPSRAGYEAWAEVIAEALVRGRTTSAPESGSQTEPAGA